MSQASICPDCGSEIPADSPAGQCPKCLLKEGIRSDFSAEHSLAATAPSPAFTGFEPPLIEQLAPLFPQLELVELLGKGGMGAVYKAKQRGLDRFVAVKILPPEVGRDPAFAERFTREARAMARLSHPHIVAIHDFGQTNGQFYFVMEYVDGANLRQVTQSKQLSPAEALAVVPQICDALQYAHDEGIVHRDIKPENILVDVKGRVKIADFGLSKLLHEDHLDASLTGTHQVMGTLRYMAPEQLQGTKSVDHRADIYSLGVVFYELLTGQLPMGRFDPPSKKVQVDVRLDEVVLRALEQEPEKRYQQASEIKSDVESMRAVPSGRASSVQPAGNSAPLVLVTGAMLMLSALTMIAGGVASALAFVLETPGSHSFWGWLGGGFGCLLGGLGSLVGCLNSYRQITGGEDLMKSPRWTWLDNALNGLAIVGGLLLLVGFLISSRVSPVATRSLLAMGGALLFQGGLFTLLRRPYRSQEADTKNGPRPLGRYAMLLAIVVFGVYLGVQLFVNDGRMPTAASAETVATIQGETGPDASGLDQGLVRYRITGPVEHKLVTWVEYYVKGEKRKLREFPQTVWRIPRPGEGVSELVELRLQDGYKLSPDGKGKLRWDWWGAGGWMPSPFVEMGTVSWTGPQDRRWRLVPGEDALLWAIKGGKGDWSSSLHWGSPAGGIMAEAKDADAFLVLKARIEPVTEAERRRLREGGGLGFEDDAYVPARAGYLNAVQSPSLQQNRATTVAPLPAADVAYFAGHTSAVRSVAVSPDGRTIVSAGADGTVIQRDLSGNVVGTMTSPLAKSDPQRAALFSVAISPAGPELYAGGNTGILHSMFRDSQPPRLIVPSNGAVRFITPYDAGRKLAFIANGDTDLVLHDLQADKLIASVSIYPGKFFGNVRAAAAASDGSCVAVTSSDMVQQGGAWTSTAPYKLTVVDTATGKESLTYEFRDGPDFSYAHVVFPDPKTLLVALPSGEMLRWVNSGDGWKPLPSVRIAPGRYTASCSARDGKSIWLAHDKQLVELHAVTGRLISWVELKIGERAGQYAASPIESLAAVADPHTVAAGLWDGRIAIARGHLEAVPLSASSAAQVSYFDGHTAEVQDVAVAADGRTIVSAGADGKIIARDRSGVLLGTAVSPVAEKSPSTAWLTSVAVTSSGSDAYAGDAKGVWHAKIGEAEPPRRILNSADTVRFVSLYDGGSKLAYVDDTEIKFYDLQNKKDLAAVRLRPEKVGGYVRAAAASPNGRHIAVNSVEKDGDGAETYTLTVYDGSGLGARKLYFLYLSYDEFYRALPVFLDDRTLLVCLPEGRMRRWTFADERREPDPTTVPIPPGFTAAAASRDGKTLYLALPISSPGDKQRIVGLDAATGKRLVAADLEVGRQLGNNISSWINALATTDQPHEVVAALWDGRVAVAKCVPFPDDPPVAAGPATIIADKSQLPAVGQPGREDLAFVFKAPPGHVLTVWLESWENGKLTIPPECCERFASGKEKPLDVTLRLATQEGKVVNPDLSGKLRFDWALGEGKTDMASARSVWLKSPQEPFSPPSPEKPWKEGTTYKNHYIAGPPTNPLDACRVKVGTSKRLYSLTTYDKSKATEDQKKRGEVLSIPDLMEGWPTAAIFVRARIDAADSFPGNMYAGESHRQLNLGDRRFTPALISLTRLAEELGAEVQDATDESEVRIALIAWLAAGDRAREQAVALLKTKHIVAAADVSAEALAELLRDAVASKASIGSATKADYEPLARGSWQPRFNAPAEVDGPAGTLKNGVITLRDFVMDRAAKPVFFRDGIVRAKIDGYGSVHLRCTGDSYQLALMADGLHIYKWQDDAPVRLASVPPEALTKAEGFRELALVAVGSHLIGYLDGKRTIELIDRSITNEGVVAIHAHQPSVQFKVVEVMSLDGVEVKDSLGGLEVLDRFVGLWNLEHTARPSLKNTEHTITSGKIATRWVLGGRYLRSDYELATGPGPIVLSTYDPLRDEYPTWVFTPSGSVVHLPRKWNAADQTLGGNVVDEVAGTTVRCDDVLHTERSIARTLSVADKDGRKVHDFSDRLLRAGDVDLSAEPGKTAAGPAAEVPQLKVLTPFTGDFATGGETTDAAGKRTPFPAGQNKNRWIMHGRLLEERGMNPDGAVDTHLCFWTYDADDEKYRNLFLPILGSHVSVAYDWDEETRALVGRGTLQSGEMATHRIQLADPDHIQWTMTPEAAGGKGPRLDGRLTRIKD